MSEIMIFNLEEEKINKKLEEFRNLAKSTVSIVINGIDDKKGYDRVHEAQMILRKKRLEIESAKKTEIKKLNEQKDQIWDFEKKFLELIVPEEERLENEKKKINDKKSRIKKEKEEAEQQKQLERINKLRDIGMYFDNAKFFIPCNLSKYSQRNLPDWGISVKDLGKKTEAEYNIFVGNILQIFNQIDENKKAEKEKQKVIETEAKKKREESEKKEREEQAERERLLQEQATIQAEEQKKLDEKREKLEAEKKRLEDGKQAEIDRGEKENREYEEKRAMDKKEILEKAKDEKIIKWKELNNFDEEIHEIKHDYSTFEIWTKPVKISSIDI